MSQKLCRAGCMYEIDGRCRLEHRLGQTRTLCPFFEREVHAYGGVRQ